MVYVPLTVDQVRAIITASSAINYSDKDLDNAVEELQRVLYATAKEAE